MGCGVNANKFFKTQEQIPYYVEAQVDERNRNQMRRQEIRGKMDNRSFSIGSHYANFPEFKAAEINEEFYKIAQSQKLNYNRFIEVTQVKFPHVLVHELVEYLLIEKQVFDQRGSQSTTYSYVTRPIGREEYVQLTYVMTHWKIVQLHPMLALFLYVDDHHQYRITYAELFQQFSLHFNATEVEFMRVFKLSKKQKNTTGIDFQAYIKRIEYLEQAFREVNPFQRYIPEVSEPESEPSAEHEITTNQQEIMNRVRVEETSGSQVAADETSQPPNGDSSGGHIREENFSL